MPRMRTRGCLPALLAVAACAGADESAVCHGDQPIQLVATDNLGFAIGATPTDTIIALTDDYGQGDVRTLLGPDCGMPARDVADGVAFQPARVHLDPADDDPDIVCDPKHGSFHRIDPAGHSPPTEVLPDLDCREVLTTRHGPLIAGPDEIWLVPDFPDEATAEQIATGVSSTALAGDRLVYGSWPTLGLRIVDLVTREDRELHAEAELLAATPTHVLWLARVDSNVAAVAPISLHDLADGTDHYVGLWGPDDYDQDYDAPYRSTPLRGWRFDPSGRSIVHVPFSAGLPMAAFDLTGQPLAFPAWGTPLLVLADGTHVIQVDETVFAARPGEAATITLDWTYGDRSWSAVPRDGALEVQVERDLYRVPLDGGPRTLIARDVGVRREWLDEHHLVTIFADELVTIRIAANVRRGHGRARGFTLVPGRGVYFNNVLTLEQDGNGIWLVPDSALRPVSEPCPSSYYCR